MGRVVKLPQVREVPASNAMASGWQIPIHLIRKLRYLVQKLRLGDKLTAGNNVNFGRRCDFRPPHFMRLGDNVCFGREVIVETNLNIGSDVVISSRVAFVGHDHDFDEPNRSVILSRRLPSNTITLEGDNIIGFGATVLGNVTIGRGCIVGAGSLVTTSLPEHTECTGVPARPVRRRVQ